MLNSSTLNRPNCTAWEWFCKAGDEFRFDPARRENSIARTDCYPLFAKRTRRMGYLLCVFAKPHVKICAGGGAERFRQAFFGSLRSFPRREFPAFKTREEALAWLAKDE